MDVLHRPAGEPAVRASGAALRSGAWRTDRRPRASGPRLTWPWPFASPWAPRMSPPPARPGPTLPPSPPAPGTAWRPGRGGVGAATTPGGSAGPGDLPMTVAEPIPWAALARVQGVRCGPVFPERGQATLPPSASVANARCGTPEWNMRRRGRSGSVSWGSGPSHWPPRTFQRLVSEEVMQTPDFRALRSTTVHP